MDLYRVINELVQERDRITRIMESLELVNQSGSEQPRKRRGRKSMDAAGRQEVSERMRRYWAARRATQPQQVLPDASR